MVRASHLLAFLLVALVIVLAIPGDSIAQGRKKRMFGGDPGESFDQKANGRASISINEFQFGKTEALQYAKDHGINNGMLNRQQYIDFREQLSAKFRGGGKGPSQGKKGRFSLPLAPPTGGLITSVSPNTPAAAPVSADVLQQLADASFKQYDSNGDGKLNKEEMPGRLRNSLAKWDKNDDGLIDSSEYRQYFVVQLSGGAGGGANAKPNRDIVTIIIEDEELDRKPIVFRAGGKMPAGLPAWFKDLDKDEDGQVALHEWRKGGKSIDDFSEWDHNDDGFITPEEALRYLASVKTKSASSSRSGNASNAQP